MIIDKYEIAAIGILDYISDKKEAKDELVKSLVKILKVGFPEKKILSYQIASILEKEGENWDRSNYVASREDGIIFDGTIDCNKFAEKLNQLIK